MLQESIDLIFKNLSYRIKKKKNEYKTLLYKLNGRFRTGELTAIMGPSGAGKTTLLNVLAGNCNERVKTGQVFINTRESNNVNKLHHRSSYIMQESELFSMLTVKESMYIASCLKLPLNTPNEDKIKIIIDIISSLGLTNCLDIRAGNLSGGEQKRLFIAQELLSDHPIIFLDEPTSGLDTVSANQCISVLKKLSENGKMIIITIHQPSELILEKMDHLYFLSQGQCFYQGPVTQLVPFLQTFGLNCPQYHNPADYANEIAYMEYGEEILKNLVNNVSLEFETKNNLLEQSSYEENPNKISRSVAEELKLFLNEVVVLLRRYTLCSSRDLVRTYLVLLGYIFCGISTGVIYHGKGYYAEDAATNISCQFFTMLVILFIGVMSSVLFFPLEYTIFKREYLNKWYKLISYFVAKTIIDIPTQAIFCSFFASIVYFTTAQPMEFWRFVLFYIISILGILNSHVIGLMIGILFGVKQGAFIASAYIIVAGLFSGCLLLPYKDAPNWVYWISFMDYIRYLWQGLNLVVLYDRDVLPCHQDTIYCYFKHTKTIYSYFGIQQGTVYSCIFALTTLLIFKLILTYFILKYKVRKN